MHVCPPLRALQSLRNADQGLEEGEGAHRLSESVASSQASGEVFYSVNSENARFAPSLTKGATVQRTLFVVTALSALVHCSSDRIIAVSGPPIIVDRTPTSDLIGPAGGTVRHPSGASIVVPPGALAELTRITLEGVAPNTSNVLGQAFEAGPEGQRFLKPVEVILPFDPKLVPAGSDAKQAQIHTAPQRSGDFQALESSVDLSAHLIRTTTVHFSDFVPVLNPNPVFITSPAELPNGMVGTNYSQTFTATGGTTPYAWSLSYGDFPSGLALTNGSLAGTPTQPAPFAFFVKASDGAGHAVQKAFSITINQAVNPAPTLAGIAPAAADQGAATVITVTGTGFVPASEVRLDGLPVPTTFVSATQLSAQVSSNTPGQHQLTVFSPAPGGGGTTATTFTVKAVVQNPVPTIVSVAPMVVPLSTVDTQVEIIGTGFVMTTSAAIGVNGISTHYVSPTLLQASIPASYLGAAGTIKISTYNPEPGGGFSVATADVYVGSSVGDCYSSPNACFTYPDAVPPGQCDAYLQKGGVYCHGPIGGWTPSCNSVSPLSAYPTCPANQIIAQGQRWFNLGQSMETRSTVCPNTNTCYARFTQVVQEDSCCL